jgi:hypothetical protein
MEPIRPRRHPGVGKRGDSQDVDIMQVRGDRITRHWLTMDELSFLQQLGVIPAEP